MAQIGPSKTLDYITRSFLSLSNSFAQPHTHNSPSPSLSSRRGSSAGAWRRWRGTSGGGAGPRAWMDTGRGTSGGGAARRVPPAAAQGHFVPPTAARLCRVLRRWCGS